MALPNTGISFPMVRDAIGESITDLIGLRSSDKVNIWGLMPPGEEQYFDANHLHNPDAANTVWNVVDTAPWEIGDFRGYDHYNRAYGLSSIEIIGDQTNRNSIKQLHMIGRYFPSWSIDDGTVVWAKYQVIFDAGGDFQKGDGTEQSLGYITMMKNSTTGIMEGYMDLDKYLLGDGDTGYIWVKEVSSVSHNFKWAKDRDFMPPATKFDSTGKVLSSGWMLSYDAGITPAVIVASFYDFTTQDGKLYLANGNLIGATYKVKGGDIREYFTISIHYKPDDNLSTFGYTWQGWVEAGAAEATKYVVLDGLESHISNGDKLTCYVSINGGAETIESFAIYSTGSIPHYI